ncbi:hypothetical protein [Spirosoma linguale]|uniref:hypothetical protein n=1 Tax=Spirosoma linguale TaxID=108 RepID=UPI0001A3B04C
MTTYNDTKLKNVQVVSLLQESPKALLNYRWANRLKVIGPALALSGLALSYVGVKGSEAMATVGGIKTVSNRNPADVQVVYRERSLAKTLGGIGLFVGGICLIELANELTNKSIVLYNDSTDSAIRTVDIGLTANGGIGLQLHL